MKQHSSGAAMGPKQDRARSTSSIARSAAGIPAHRAAGNAIQAVEQTGFGFSRSNARDGSHTPASWLANAVTDAVIGATGSSFGTSRNSRCILLNPAAVKAAGAANGSVEALYPAGRRNASSKASVHVHRGIGGARGTAVAASVAQRNAVQFSILGAGLCAIVALGMSWVNSGAAARAGNSYFDNSSVLTTTVDKQLLTRSALPGIGQMLVSSASPDATIGYGLGFDVGLLPATSNPWRPARSESIVAPHDQRAVTAWLARKYRVAGDAANMLVSATYTTAKDLKFDPLLILAVMAIESGLNPIAESPMGAQGLMQVMSKVHHEKFRPLGGVEAALNPVANIKVGSMILKDYVKRGGSVEAGLKMYVGAAAFDSDDGYGFKVLAEYRRLQEVARGKTVAMNAIMQRAAPVGAAAGSSSGSGSSSGAAQAGPALTAPMPEQATMVPSAKPKLVDGNGETQKTAEPVQHKPDVLASA